VLYAINLGVQVKINKKIKKKKGKTNPTTELNNPALGIVSEIFESSFQDLYAIDGRRSRVCTNNFFLDFRNLIYKSQLIFFKYQIHNDTMMRQEEDD
jgi:hypothetical protein